MEKNNKGFLSDLQPKKGSTKKNVSKDQYYDMAIDSRKNLSTAKRQEMLEDFAAQGVSGNKWADYADMHRYYADNVKKIRQEVPPEVFDVLMSNIEGLDRVGGNTYSNANTYGLSDPKDIKIAKRNLRLN